MSPKAAFSNAVVIGASGGIGKALVAALMADGVQIVHGLRPGGHLGESGT